MSSSELSRQVDVQDTDVIDDVRTIDEELGIFRSAEPFVVNGVVLVKGDTGIQVSFDKLRECRMTFRACF